MADNDTQTQQAQQGAGQEHGQEHEAGQQAQDQGQDVAGAQGANTERDEATETDDVQALRREAAGRRRALRTVEAERDALRQREDRRDRAEAERIAASRMADPSDLWSLDGVALENFRDEDGELVGELVAASVTDALVKKPHWRRQTPGDAPNLHQGARQEVAEVPSFGQALKADGGR